VNVWSTYINVGTLIYACIMNTSELRRALECNSSTSTHDIIVASAEYIPPHNKILLGPSGYIINTDTSQYSGRHWVAIWISDDGTCEFFDSYSHAPSHYEREIKLIPYIEERFGRIAEYNRKNLQHSSTAVCGHYAMYFIFRKTKGCSMSAIVKPFDSRTLMENDKSIYAFVSEYFTMACAQTRTIRSQVCHCLE
jgi:hypothetical protein